MRPNRLILTGLVLLCFSAAGARADVVATANHVAAGVATPAFKFDSVPSPAADDLATAATFTLVDGERDANGADLDALHDGKLPQGQDEPAGNYFFNAHTLGGRIQIDMAVAKEVTQINTYSWHSDTRAPQVYKVYIADGTEDGFVPEPKLFIDPADAGWKLLASVDTRPKDGTEAGGQYGVSVHDTAAAASLGSIRYVLFDVSRTEGDDAFGNTFFSEIDVVSADKAQLLKSKAVTDQPGPGEAYKVTVDTTGLPDDMKAWANDKLEPACKAWYPKIVDMLPSDGYAAPRQFTVAFRTDMGGTPAYTSGNRVSCNLDWFEKNRDGEGVGAVIHELVHVVQQYKFGRKNVPFWLQEGIPDYVRWYQFEPEKHGTHIRDASKVKYDNAYRVSANFLNWATQTYDKDLVRKLNAALRQGRYIDDMWKDLTHGKTLDELDGEWKASLKTKS